VLTLFYRYSSVRTSHITEEIKKTISTKQAEVKDAITTADKQLGPKENKTEALRQLEEERKALDISRKLLDELLSKSQEEAVAKAAAYNQSSSNTVTFGDGNSGFQAGTINGGVSGITFGGK